MRLLLTLAILLAPVQAWATTYYVSKSGSNANSCVTAQSTTQSNQKLTVAAGIACMASGDTLQIHTGTYAETIATDATLRGISGTTWGNASTIKAIDGETVTISSIGGCGTAGTTRYIIFDHLFVAGSVGLSACSDSSVFINHIRFTNIDVTNAHAQNHCFNLNGETNSVGQYTEIVNSYVHGCGTFFVVEMHGIYVATDHVLIQDTEIYDTAGYCIHNFGGAYANTNTFNRNKLHKCGTENSTQTAFAVGMLSGVDNVLSNSLIYDSANGVQVGSAGGQKIYNNTIYNNGQASPSIPCGAHCQDTIYSTAASVEVRNNIVYNNVGNVITNSGSGAVTSNNPTSNPTFTDVSGSNRDLTLQSSSNAIDAGATIAAVTTDYLSVARPRQTAYDVGAYEYQVVPATTTSLASVAGNGQVVLTWADALYDVTSYNIRRGTTPGSLSTIDTSATSDYTDATAVNGTTYYYGVTSVNAAGTSAASNEVSATPENPVLTSFRPRVRKRVR